MGKVAKFAFRSMLAIVTALIIRAGSLYVFDNPSKYVNQVNVQPTPTEKNKSKKLENQLLEGLSEPIYEDTDSKRDAREMEEYFAQSKPNDPLRYKIMLFEYLPTLEVLNDKERIKKCKVELAETYAGSLKKLDSWITLSTEPHYKKSMRKLKREIIRGVRKEKIF